MLFKKEHKYSSFLIRNLKESWPVLLLACIPFLIWRDFHFGVFAVAIVIIGIGIVHNERRQRYFVEEISVEGNQTRVVYYKYGKQHTMLLDKNPVSSIRTFDYKGFKWREPVLEIADGKNRLLQFGVCGWTKADFEKASAEFTA